MTRITRKRLAQIEREGLTITKIVHGKHLKLHVTAPDGRKIILTCSQTPSDWRVDIKVRSQLKRFRASRSPTA
jgi:hypothetical protein